ncbi:hypothetical protein TSL6_07730 [Sulfurovum sp. TSL6]|nr:hypothetical protein TSL6_07730 [Sulfurovum sp. TSL6]
MGCHYTMAQKEQNSTLLSPAIKEKAPLRYNRDNIIM